MENNYLLIIGIVIIVVALYHYLQVKNKKKMDAPYFRIRDALEKDYEKENFSGNWRQRQEIKMKLIWLDVLKEDCDSDPLFPKDADEVINRLASLTEDEILYPLKWNLEDYSKDIRGAIKDYKYRRLAEKIAAAWGEILADNDYETLYKPESLLSVPKDMIRKSMQYIFDFSKKNPDLYEHNKHLVVNLRVTVPFLDYFIDTNIEIPKNKEDFDSKIYSVLMEEDRIQKERQADISDLIDW